MEERRPVGSGWVRYDAGPLTFHSNTLSVSVWKLGPFGVISALEDAELPDGSKRNGPQWHISVTLGGKRAKDSQLRKVLRAFGMVGAEEDNHHPGNARHFWLPLDPAARTGCECKVTEAVIVEPDGYTWTNPKPETGEPCRGCELVALGVPRAHCQLHEVRP